jgi:hypothetical protein
MIDYKGAASWVEVKDSSVMATYPLVEQATVMDRRFGRMSRSERACGGRRGVGTPSGSCNCVDRAIDFSLACHGKSVSNRASKSKANCPQPVVLCRRTSSTLDVGIALPRVSQGSGLLALEKYFSE